MAGSNIMANIVKIGALSLINKGGSDSSNGSTSGTQSINIPGTIMGNLKDASKTSEFKQSVARYNNYLTDIFGAAQMASDRYMSLKERIPMIIEWQKTHNKKSSITMYINPEKLSVSTKKIEHKQVTRGGIYYHIYGDDIWDLTLNGTCGYAQMRGIEALEEAYHYSGTLLKYQNVKQSTVHTNEMYLGASVDSSNNPLADNLLAMLNGDDENAKGIARTIGGLTDTIGLTNISFDKENGKYTNSNKAKTNLFTSILNSANSSGGCFGKLGEFAKKSGIQDIFNMAQATTGNCNNISGMVGALTNLNQIKSTSSLLTGALAADIIGAVTGKNGGNLSSVCGTLTGNIGDSLTNITALLLGGTGALTDTTYSSPDVASYGTYYDLKSLSTNDLNNVVSTVQKKNSAWKNLYESAQQLLDTDISSQIYDEYRPRLTTIYFDDRVYIGHFSSFNYDREAATLLIKYNLKFTVVRQIVLSRNNLDTSGASSGWGGVKNALLSTAVGYGVNQIFGLNGKG